MSHLLLLLALLAALQMALLLLHRLQEVLHIPEEALAAAAADLCSRAGHPAVERLCLLLLLLVKRVLCPAGWTQLLAPASALLLLLLLCYVLGLVCCKTALASRLCIRQPCNARQKQGSQNTREGGCRVAGSCQVALVCSSS